MTLEEIINQLETDAIKGISKKPLTPSYNQAFCDGMLYAIRRIKEPLQELNILPPNE